MYERKVLVNTWDQIVKIFSYLKYKWMYKINILSSFFKPHLAKFYPFLGAATLCMIKIGYFLKTTKPITFDLSLVSPISGPCIKKLLLQSVANVNSGNNWIEIAFKSLVNRPKTSRAKLIQKDSQWYYWASICNYKVTGESLKWW